MLLQARGLSLCLPVERCIAQVYNRAAALYRSPGSRGPSLHHFVTIAPTMLPACWRSAERCARGAHRMFFARELTSMRFGFIAAAAALAAVFAVAAKAEDAPKDVKGLYL